jgi:intracellular sulfur oxidation DsrE/DsrF family protein
MKLRTILAAILFSVPALALAEEPSAGPYIDAGGPAFKVEDRDVPLVDGMKYRVVFEATGYPGEPDAINRELTVVARFMNMHGKNGVPLEDLDVAVVLHGRALFAAMTNEVYREEHGIDNPNLGLLNELAEAGVEFYACGQSLGFRGLEKSALASPVKVGLSALTMLVTLQAKGYAYLSTRT